MLFIDNLVNDFEMNQNRLPKEDERVLVHRSDGNPMYICTFSPNFDKWNDAGEWIDDDAWCCHPRFDNYWMSLPDPPK